MARDITEKRRAWERAYAKSEKRLAYAASYKAKPENKARAHVLRKEKYAANPEKYLASQRKRYYGITSEQADSLFESQNKTCAICKADSPGGRGAWHLDHDHVTSAIRGFLCHVCNAGLGFFKDDPLRLELAALYLRKAALK